MDTSPQPVNLQLAGENSLRIEWSDGERREYTFRELRDRCPCATCREKRKEPPAPSTSLPILSAAEVRPLKILGMKPVGNYAYAIEFSDGHDTGIYTLEHLREMGRVVADLESNLASPHPTRLSSSQAGPLPEGEGGRQMVTESSRHVRPTARNP